MILAHDRRRSERQQIAHRRRRLGLVRILQQIEQREVARGRSFGEIPGSRGTRHAALRVRTVAAAPRHRAIEHDRLIGFDDGGKVGRAEVAEIRGGQRAALARRENLELRDRRPIGLQVAPQQPRRGRPDVEQREADVEERVGRALREEPGEEPARMRPVRSSCRVLDAVIVGIAAGAVVAARRCRVESEIGLPVSGQPIVILDQQVRGGVVRRIGIEGGRRDRRGVRDPSRRERRGLRRDDGDDARLSGGDRRVAHGARVAGAVALPVRRGGARHERERGRQRIADDHGIGGRLPEIGGGQRVGHGVVVQRARLGDLQIRPGRWIDDAVDAQPVCAGGVVAAVVGGDNDGIEPGRRSIHCDLRRDRAVRAGQFGAVRPAQADLRIERRIRAGLADADRDASPLDAVEVPLIEIGAMDEGFVIDGVQRHQAALVSARHHVAGGRERERQLIVAGRVVTAVVGRDEHRVDAGRRRVDARFGGERAVLEVQFRAIRGAQADLGIERRIVTHFTDAKCDRRALRRGERPLIEIAAMDEASVIRAVCHVTTLIARRDLDRKR